MTIAQHFKDKMPSFQFINLNNFFFFKKKTEIDQLNKNFNRKKEKMIINVSKKKKKN